MPELPFAFPLDAQTIRAKRSAILCAAIERFPELRRVPPPRFPTAALPYLLAAYDASFLGGYLASRPQPVRISASTRMTRAAGTCTVTKQTRMPVSIEIRMGIDFLFRLGEGPFEANGLTFDTALEAFLSVLEHELCHALDVLLHRKLGGHGPHFRTLASGLFGHTECTHKLPTRAEEAARSGVGVGRWVQFDFEGRALRGQVTRVGKTATVMVPSPSGTWHDRQGGRYAKYLVPPEDLTAAPRE